MNLLTITRREEQVLGYLAESGATSKEIGREIGLSAVTVNGYVETACRKLGARNRMHAAVLWGRIVADRERINTVLALKLSHATEAA